MDIAALASFALLLIAWIVAPDRQREPAATESVAAETSPVPA
jgi:hypothetical protein